MVKASDSIGTVQDCKTNNYCNPMMAAMAARQVTKSDALQIPSNPFNACSNQLLLVSQGF
jgi:hypothetical protein